MLNNVSERGGMITCRVYAPSVSPYSVCDQKHLSFIRPLYEFGRRNFMPLCNNKIDFP